VTYRTLARPNTARGDIRRLLIICAGPGKERFIEAEIALEPLPDGFRPVAAPWHTVFVLCLIATLAYWGKLRSDQARLVLNPDRVSMYERTILFEWLMLGLVLVGVWLNGSSLFAVLGDRWRSGRQFLREVGIGLLFLIASIMVSSMAGPHGGAGDKVTQFLLPQGKIEIALWVVLSLTAGICEEAVYRGYLQKQFMALTKSVPAGIFFPAVAFGVAHSYQGLARASMIAVMGAMSGILAYWCRSVRPGMIAHALEDVLGGLVRH
jgi:membrane protease YdiL (CAAX protease family)